MTESPMSSTRGAPGVAGARSDGARSAGARSDSDGRGTDGRVASAAEADACVIARLIVSESAAATTNRTTAARRGGTDARKPMRALGWTTGDRLVSTVAAAT